MLLMASNAVPAKFSQIIYKYIKSPALLFGIAEVFWFHIEAIMKLHTITATPVRVRLFGCQVHYKLVQQFVSAASGALQNVS